MGGFVLGILAGLGRCEIRLVSKSKHCNKRGQKEVQELAQGSPAIKREKKM